MSLDLVTRVEAAMPGAPNLSIGKPENVAITNIGTLIQGAVQGAIVVSALLVFMFLIWGGIQWITSGGANRYTLAPRDPLPAGLIGLAVVASAWAIMLIISYFFGINILDGNITPPKAY